MFTKLLKIILLLGAPILLAALMLQALQTTVSARPNPNNLEVQVMIPTEFFMDFNNWCRASNPLGPESAWYIIRLTNTTNNQVYTGLQLNVTPAISMTIDDPVRYVGNLAPNQSKEVFVYIDYSRLRDWMPCSNGNPPISYNQPITFTVVSLDNGMSGTKTQVVQFQTNGMISANSGGQFISSELGSGSYVGQLLTTTVVYGFGNNQSNSGLLLQPSGNSTFHDTCYRLIDTKVQESSVLGVSVGVTNTLWFPTTDTENNDVVKMKYTFQMQCAISTTITLPWSEITGGQNSKYNSQSYTESSGVPLPPVQPVETVLNISKSVSPSQVAIHGTVTYTVRLQNSATQPIQATILRDLLPSGFVYKGFATGSEVTAVNSSISPTLNTTGTLNWYGYPYATYTVPASGTLQANTPGELKLIYHVQAPMTAGEYTNWVTTTVGMSSLGPVSTTVRVYTPTAVMLAYFDATLTSHGALLSWQTTLETNLLGFKLYRSMSPDGPYELLTPQVIRPQLGMPGGTEYTWLDESIQPGGVYYYRLVDIDSQLHETLHGPVMLAYLILPPQAYFPLVERP